ncbi:MAG: ArsA-related P-loop ATPase [Myxococcota bacterium]
MAVLGKGGVGRSTVTAALGVAAARLGKRVCVAELGQDSALPPKLGLGGRSFAFRRGSHGVDVWSVTVSECLRDFARRKLGLPSFASSVVHNRFVDTFVDAVPGLNDLLVLGKIENLLNEPHPSDPQFDVLILDAPATGHGLTLLQAARTMSEITRAGPFHDLADTIDRFLSDPTRTATVAVTLLEELPVQETLELCGALVAEGFPPAAVIANAVEPPPIPSPPGAAAVLAALEHLEGAAPLRELVVEANARADRHASALQALQVGAAPLGVATVCSAPRATDVAAIGAALAAQLGGSR